MASAMLDTDTISDKEWSLDTTIELLALLFALPSTAAAIVTLWFIWTKRSHRNLGMFIATLWRQLRIGTIR